MKADLICFFQILFLVQYEYTQFNATQRKKKKKLPSKLKKIRNNHEFWIIFIIQSFTLLSHRKTRKKTNREIGTVWPPPHRQYQSIKWCQLSSQQLDELLLSSKSRLQSTLIWPAISFCNIHGNLLISDCIPPPQKQYTYTCTGFLSADLCVTLSLSGYYV